jgi:hypothetical protein
MFAPLLSVTYYQQSAHTHKPASNFPDYFHGDTIMGLVCHCHCSLQIQIGWKPSPTTPVPLKRGPAKKNLKDVRKVNHRKQDSATHSG